MSGGRIKVGFLLMVLCLFLVACSGRNENPASNPEYAKYFTGKQGVVANLVNFPPRLYYYGVQDTASNEFTFSVEVRNDGSSFTRGGVYISGFDPNMMQFNEFTLSPGGLGACGISFGTIGFGSVGGIFRCDGVSVTGGGGQTSVRIDSLQQLIQGISGRFGKSWWDESQFDLGVQYTTGGTGDNFIINFGTSNVEYYQHGRLFLALLAGIRFDINGGREFFLAGDTYDFPGGETDYFVYTGQIVEWPPGLDQTTQNFLLTTCYQYTTFADPIVCIDPEPFSDNRKVCTPRSRTWSGGQGAPVAVTSIEQENSPRKIIFRINVQNVGGGTVYDPGSLERCSPYYPGRVTPEDLNVVYLGDVRIGQVGLAGRGGTGGMECSPEIIRLDPKTGRGSTTCTYPMDQNVYTKTAYQAPLTVELWYGYSQTQQRTVQIKRIV